MTTNVRLAGDLGIAHRAAAREANFLERIGVHLRPTCVWRSATPPRMLYVKCGRCRLRTTGVSVSWRPHPPECRVTRTTGLPPGGGEPC